MGLARARMGLATARLGMGAGRRSRASLENLRYRRRLRLIPMRKLRWILLAVLLSAPIAACSKCDVPTWPDSFHRGPSACHSDEHVE